MALAEKTQDVAGSPTKTSDVVKISVNLSRPVFEALRQMAAQQGTTVTDILRRAISTEKFVLDATSRDAKILIEEKGQTTKQLVFPR